MNKLKKVVAAAIIAGAIPVSFTAAQTQRDMENESCGEYKAADRELNAVYRQIFAENRSSPKLLQKLRTAQRAWILFRNAHVESLFPEADKQREYGTMYTMCYCLAQAETTKKRTAELKLWLNKGDPDACGFREKL